VTACVIGVGNAMRGDDAVGLEVARLLAGSLPAGVAVHTCEGEPIALLDLWAQCDHVVLVDAMQSGAVPGTIRSFDAVTSPLPPELARPSTHLVGVGEAVELARALDRLPERLEVHAIEAGQLDAGAPLSASVAAAAAIVATSIRESLREA
jgi:hydrogenase maturation protease